DFQAGSDAIRLGAWAQRAEFLGLAGPEQTLIELSNLNLLHFNLGNRKTGAAKRLTRSSLLGLTLDGHRLEGVVARKLDGSVRLQNSVAASLQLNLLTDAPELVGREIRNHLDKAGIRERQCAVCIPLEWALTLHVPLPDLPALDLESFLNIE